MEEISNIDEDLVDLVRSAAASLGRQGVPEPLATARALLADLRRDLGGNRLHIRKPFEIRNAEIRRAYNGRNAAELAARFGLAKKTIQNIV